ncbi:MAG: energy transducer TonB [Syntrophotaleaceae bacterium]
MTKWLRNNSFFLFSVAVNLLLFLSIPLLSHLSLKNRQTEISSSFSFRKATRVRPPDPDDRELPKEPPKPKQLPKIAEVVGFNQTSRSTAPNRPRMSLNTPSFEMAAGTPEMGLAVFAPMAQPQTEFDLGEVDSQPMPVSRISPVYPYDARQKGIEGVVMVKFLVDGEGRVTRVSVVDSKPPDVFDQAALDAVRQWRFQPASLDGETVATWMSVPIRFRMNE